MTSSCLSCGEQVTVHPASAWPEQCPHCKASPLALGTFLAPIAPALTNGGFGRAPFEPST